MARILVVEDDIHIRTLLDDFLSSIGHEIVVASDGRSALELARSTHPDAILMDLMLPLLDGRSATRDLKRNPETSAIPVIAMSAGENLREPSANLPAERRIAKPFDLEDVRSTLDQLLDRNQPESNRFSSK